jgi:hypothetical protein
VCAEATPKPLSFGSLPERACAHTENQALRVFSFPVTVPSHDSNEPAWAAGRENTGRGFTCLRTTLPVSEGQHKREKTWVRQLLYRANRYLLGLPVFSFRNMGMDDSPSRVLRIDGGLSPLGNLEADDAIDEMRQELTVDTYKITYYCSP